MRLGDAIRMGSLLIKPLRGVQYRPGDEDTVAGCAWGMALTAVGAYPVANRDPSAVPETTRHTVRSFFLWSMNHPCGELPCGCTGVVMQGGGSMEIWRGFKSVSNAIVHIFNQHVIDGSWTIERLADWVNAKNDEYDQEDPPKKPKVTKPETVAV